MHYIDIAPAQLIATAMQHDLIATNIRKWGVVPHAWLAEFQPAYGTIAEPVRAALVAYYDRRHAHADRLAAKHERTRDELIAAARALEDADQSGGSRIVQAGAQDDSAVSIDSVGASPNPAMPMVVGLDMPTLDDNQPDQPVVSEPDVTGVHGGAGGLDQAPLVPTASLSPIYNTAHVEDAVPTRTTPLPPGALQADASPMPGSPTIGISSAPSTPTVPGPFTLPVHSSGAGATRELPAPLAVGPFIAAARAGDNRQALPSLTVGARIEDDLMLARTLLAATLAAVAGSALGLEWAVAVGRTPVGPVVVLTSTEGRGWLPAGLHLPSEVTLPSRWDSILSAADRRALATFEGNTDPARILAEFVAMVADHYRNVRMSALVSSAEIPNDTRSFVGAAVAVEDRVTAAESAVDLTSGGIGLVDRLGLTASDEVLRRVATVPEMEIRDTCLELARVADRGARAAAPSADEGIAIRRAWRRRILDALHTSRVVPAGWWDRIPATYGMTAAKQPARVDISPTPIGIRPAVAGAYSLPNMFFERRADELLLTFSQGEPDRQSLRDAFYTYDQIVGHPLFSAGAVQTVNTNPMAGPGAPVSSSTVGFGTPGPSSVPIGFTHGGSAIRRRVAERVMTPESSSEQGIAQ
ncbi:type VII secretion target [Nocardia sp. NPDC003963]